MALTAARIVHVEAKAALDAATEAFKAASYKTSESEKTFTPCILTLGSDSDQEMADPDEAEEDFIMLSTKKGPVIDLEDYMSPTPLHLSSWLPPMALLLTTRVTC